MARKKRIIPLAAVERIIRQAGAERVSPEAVKALAELMEDFAKEVASEAARYARIAKRKTIRREDIELAASG